MVDLLKREQPAGRVYLVGAGPGDAELLTLKAARLLAGADIILHDDLISESVLALAGAQTLVVSVGKRMGAKRVTQEETNALMISAARSGLEVVRLKSGDPLVFGRAAEEMDALEAAGTPYEVVPGITAAFAAAAALKCSLTDRRVASGICISTGHRAAKTRSEDDAPTRVVYMPGPCLDTLAAEWLDGGASPSLPCVVISRVSQPDQQIARMALRELGEHLPQSSPVLVLAGWALAERAEFSDASGALPISGEERQQLARAQAASHGS